MQITKTELLAILAKSSIEMGVEGLINIIPPSENEWTLIIDSYEFREVKCPGDRYTAPSYITYVDAVKYHFEDERGDKLETFEIDFDVDRMVIDMIHEIAELHELA